MTKRNIKLLYLAGIALASGCFYLLLAWRYPLAASLDNPRASWASQIEPTIANAALHIAVIFSLILLYLAALRLLHTLAGENVFPQNWQVGIIIAGWIACSGVLMAVAPAGESHDIFDYLFRGRMMVEYHDNPLVDVPSTFGLSIPYTRFLAWRKNVDTYGPVWEAASAGVSSSVRQVARWLRWWDDQPSACPGSPESCRLLMTYISGYRLLAILLTGLSGWLIWIIVKTDQPTLAVLALAMWLWNPLTLIATALGAHNDAVLIVMLLAGWWLLQRQRPFWGLLVLILAAHVKLTALIWLPACSVWIIWRWGWKRAIKVSVAAAASGLALSWLLYAPFGGWQTLPRMLQERSAFLANSPWRILKQLLIDLRGWSRIRAHQLSVGLANGLFIAGALLIPLWMFNFRPKRWRSAPISQQEINRTLWRAMATVSMLYLLVGSYWFQHWYVLWALAPAVLLPDSRLACVTLPWLAFGALSLNVLMDFLLATVLKTSPKVLGYLLSVAIIWGPVIIVICFDAIIRRWSKRA